eukprot:403334608
MESPQDASSLQIHPAQLFSIDTEFSNEIQKSVFGWAWVKRINNPETYRVLTIRDGSYTKFPDMPDKLLPSKLRTLNYDFYGEVHDHYFNWRWFKDISGNDVRVVTIEDFTESIPPFEVTVQHEWGVNDLIWDNDFAHDHNYQPQWRWYRRGKTAEFYKVLTLE